jgi:tetratricopeptide (TPR) repeat protein
MSMQGLSPKDQTQIRDAQARLQTGDANGAMLQLADVAKRTQHPEALHLFAFALLQNNRDDEARRVLETCLELSPNHAPYWNSYGSVMDEMGHADKAAAAFHKAGTLAPGYADPWINLARIALRFNDLSEAKDAIEKALRIEPKRLEILELAGTVARQSKEPEQAAKYYAQTLAVNAGDQRVRHNLASTLRELDLSEAALVEADKAVKVGSTNPATLNLRGHLLADLGRYDEALAQYEAVSAANPGFIDAHEMLAKLLPQLGQGKAALDGYRRALAAEPQNRLLLGAAMSAAHDMKDHAQLTEWAQMGMRTFGDEPEYRLSLAAAHQHAGDHRSAHDLLVGRYDELAVARLFLSHSLLCMHDPKAAEAHALAATQLAPLDQSGWAHLTIIWRLLEDAREQWLADYDRFVMPVDIELPTGVREQLEAMHTMQMHPAEQSLRGGTQTRGNLFDRRVPEIQALAQEIRRAINAQVAALPDDPTHPFLSRKAANMDYSASWSVRLASEGFHINHIHPMGWISSALYIDLPPKMGKKSGALTFGVPEAAYGLDLAPRRIEVPKVGRLVLFPSYFWHGTLPFKNEKHRLTVAFDAVPGVL